MRVLQPDEARIRLGWLRPLARLAHEKIRGPKRLGAALLRDYEVTHRAWVAPSSRYTWGLTKTSSESIARTASLYGLEIPEESEFVPLLRTVLLSLDPWPDGGSDNPFVWDDGLAFVGLSALLSVNGDLLIRLLTRWDEGAEPLPLLASVVDELLASSGGEREQALITAKRLLDTRQAEGSRAWKRVGRPWLEPLVELGVLRADPALQYTLAPRGAAMAARWRANPMATEQRLSETLAEDWVIALGHSPRCPTDEELLVALAACPNFGQPGQRVARLEELALWVQATWIRSAPGVCASAPTLLRLLGRVGFAAAAGVELGSGLMSYETFLRWTSRPIAAPLESALLAPNAKPAIVEQRPAPTEVAPPTATAADASVHGDPGGEPPARLDEIGPTAPPSSPPPMLPLEDEVEREHPAPLSHFLAWRSYALSLLDTPGALAMGGPRLWLRQLEDLLSDPAAAHLIPNWRKELQWRRSDLSWNVEDTLLAGLVELRNVKLARGLPSARVFVDLLERWQNVQADLNRVRGLRQECARGLDSFQRALLDLLRGWLQSKAQTSDLEKWPDIRRITRWILADAVLLGGHKRDALRNAVQRLHSSKFEGFARHLTHHPRYRWVVTQTFQLLGVGLNERLLKNAREGVARGFAERAEGALKIHPAIPGGWEGMGRSTGDSLTDQEASHHDTPKASEWWWTAEANLKANSQDGARDEAVLLFSQVSARARLMLTSGGASSPQVRPGVASEPKRQDSQETEGGTLVEGVSIEDDHPDQRVREAPNPTELGFEAASPPVDPVAFELFDDALLSLERATRGEGEADETAATEITLIWVALERLQPDIGGGRAGKVQESASWLMARLSLAAEAGDLLRRALAVLHVETLTPASPNADALNLWRVLYGEDEVGKYANAGSALPGPRALLFGESLAVNDEDALLRLAKLAQETPKGASGRKEPLGELARLVGEYDALLALDLRALGRDLRSQKDLCARLRAERLLIAGAIHRAYRVRNRLVHASDTGLGDDRELFAELRRHLVPKVDQLIAALMHPRCSGLTLPVRWAQVHECLDRVPLDKEGSGEPGSTTDTDSTEDAEATAATESTQSKSGRNKKKGNGGKQATDNNNGGNPEKSNDAKEGTDNQSIPVPDLLARSAWGTPD